MKRSRNMSVAPQEREAVLHGVRVLTHNILRVMVGMVGHRKRNQIDLEDDILVVADLIKAYRAKAKGEQYLDYHIANDALSLEQHLDGEEVRPYDMGEKAVVRSALARAAYWLVRSQTLDARMSHDLMHSESFRRELQMERKS